MQEELNSSIIIQIIITICIFMTGIYFHLKIIKISKKEKDVTWKLDVTNSCLLVAHLGHCVIMDTITYIIPNLYTYTGEWLCYTSKVFNLYGNIYGTAHSLIISTLKYILIIHWKRARDVGKDKVKIAFFWINILYPCFMVLLHTIIKPDFFLIYDSFARAERCLGDPKNIWAPNSNRTHIKLHTVCKILVAPSTEDYFAYTIYILRSGVCWAQVVFEYLVFWSMLEPLLYCRIFAFMRR